MFRKIMCLLMLLCVSLAAAEEENKKKNKGRFDETIRQMNELRKRNPFFPDDFAEKGKPVEEVEEKSVKEKETVEKSTDPLADLTIKALIVVDKEKSLVVISKGDKSYRLRVGITFPLFTGEVSKKYQVLGIYPQGIKLKDIEKNEIFNLVR
ncbi:MAG: hypothetical protein HRT88_23580 [Lentisphaeraceae bacterium]|nr:hypothetical protein [Lentisphaeraceae bacterium]